MAYFNEAVNKVIDAIELTPDGGDVMEALVDTAYSLGYDLMAEDKQDMVWLMIDDALTVAHEDGRHEGFEKLLPTIVDVAPEKFMWCDTDMDVYDALLMCSGDDGKTHGYFTDERFVGYAAHVERPSKVDYDFGRFADAATGNVRDKLGVERQSERIGKLVVDAIEALAADRLWKRPCVKGLNEFEPGTEVYVFNGYGAISLADWSDFWSEYPKWYEMVYMLSDNGEYTSPQVWKMSIQEVERRYRTCSCETVHYTVA